MEKIKVKNNSSGEAGYTLPNSNIRRSWLPGQTLAISVEELEEGFYEPGIKILFTSGLLFIDSIEDRKKCGLIVEEEDYKVDETVGLYSKEEILAALKEEKTGKLAIILKKAKPSMYDLIIDLAVNNEITSSDKVKLIKETTGKDVLQIVQIRKKLEEE